MEKVEKTPALLDKVSIYGFEVIDIEDMESLIKNCVVTINTGKSRYLETKNGEIYSEIRIVDDDCFDSFIYALSKDGHPYGNLQLSIKGKKYANLVGNTCDDYRKIIDNVRARLLNNYGITVNFKNAKYKLIEISKTIVTNTYFDGYRRILDLLVSLFPAQLRLKEENTWKRYERNANLLKSKMKSETYVRSSGERGITVEIYDKTKELYEKYKIEVGYNYLRFEIKLKSPSKIEKECGTNDVHQLSDEKINEFFGKFIIKNVETPYYEYCSERDKALLNIIKSNYLTQSHTWIRDSILAICNYEIKNSIPLMLEIDEIINVLDSFKFRSRQCKCNAKKQFRRLAEEK